jgi:Domain of unknown function (DUF4395)
VSELKRIDPRGPRFGAAITSAISLAGFILSQDSWLNAAPISILLFVLFAWSVFYPASHPYGFIFKKFVRPRLGDPKELEDPRPPQFAQKVGFGFSILGMVGVLFWPVLIPVSAAFIFFAAFLNAFFNFCLGCQMYLGLRRLGLIGK